MVARPHAEATGPSLRAAPAGAHCAAQPGAQSLGAPASVQRAPMPALRSAHERHRLAGSEVAADVPRRNHPVRRLRRP